MIEVNIRPSSDFTKQQRILPRLKLIPACMRDLHGKRLCKTCNAARQQTKSFVLSQLFAHFKERLHTHTDAKQGNATCRHLLNNRVQTACAQPGHEITERANSR